MRKELITKVVSVCILLLVVISIHTVSFGAKQARIFSNNRKSTYGENKYYAKMGLEKLGWSVSSQLAYRSDIMSWINTSSNNYGLYVDSYGENDSFYDINYISTYPSQVSGNWHFVYLDCGKSANSNAFAQAFHIYGYSNRAFLGWYNDVSNADSNLFNYYFWNDYITTRSIQSAAVSSSSRVPGSGTTPIRFYGDSSWYGYGS